MVNPRVKIGSKKGMIGHFHWGFIEKHNCEPSIFGNLKSAIIDCLGLERALKVWSCEVCDCEPDVHPCTYADNHQTTNYSTDRSSRPTEGWVRGQPIHQR